MTRSTQRGLAIALVAAVTVAACSDDGNDGATEGSTTLEATIAPTTELPVADTTEPPPMITEDRAGYILPPGNYGGLPTSENSTDQLPLYDGLTPLRGDIDDADLDEYFLPLDFEPVGETTEEPIPRDGVTVLYDEFGVAHVTGETREDVAYGAGWVSARDRRLLFELGRGPARAAVVDVPGIDAFSLVTSGQEFVPSEAAEQVVTEQVQLIIDTYGDEGEEIVGDAEAYAEGLNAYAEANGIDVAPATVNDVIATTAFIGSIFGAGGGSEARNAEFLSALENRLGDDLGRDVWEDLLPWDDPEAPTTIEEEFDYGALTGGDVVGSVPIDEGSLVPIDVVADGEALLATPGGTPQGIVGDVRRDATNGPIGRKASNWLLIDPEVSDNATTLAVQGPQLGYYYPEIVQQIHLSGPGIDAQGAAVPGLAMYILIGRTEDYSWSLTSANQDVRDVYAEILCEPDGATPTVESDHYEYEGSCVAFEEFDAGTLGGVPIRYPTSIHGPVIGTATSEGRPVALTSKRSTFGRDALNLAALKDMTEGDADTPEAFFDIANKFGFTFNWGYANRDGIAYFASGYLPERPAGLDRRLPTLGTGDYEWTGFLDGDEHPHADGHPSGRLLNWNNQSAPGFMHGDGNQYGSVHRVENFDQWPDSVDLAGVVGVMNRAATEDTRSSVWPVIREVLASAEPPSELAAQVVEFVDAWAADDAPLLDADNDGFYDTSGSLLFDTVFTAAADAVIEPVLGDVIADGVELRGIDTASLVDKDLRTLLGDDVEGPFLVDYCGEGDLDICVNTMWTNLDAALQQLASERGPDPATWLPEGRRTTFTPGLIPDDFRSTNRPTYQQILEFAPQ